MGVAALDADLPGVPGKPGPKKAFQVWGQHVPSP